MSSLFLLYHDVLRIQVPSVVIESCVAVVGAILVVSLLTTLIETLTPVPTFQPQHQERFDQSTFTGRFLKMLLGCDPQLLLYNEQEVRHCLSMTKNYKKYYNNDNNSSSTSTTNHNTNNVEIDRLLWQAQRIAEAALHPETEEWIPRPCRMSGYLPFNGPICVAMILAPTTASLLFWSWLNQSQNALINYYHRSSTTTTTTNNNNNDNINHNDDNNINNNNNRWSSLLSSSTKSAGAAADAGAGAGAAVVTDVTTIDDNKNNNNDNIFVDATTILPLIQSYAAAVGIALLIAFGLDSLVHHYFEGEKAAILARYISFPSAMIASSWNCYIMRCSELETGVPLLDEHGQNIVVGLPAVAAVAKLPAPAPVDDDNGDDKETTATTTITEAISSSSQIAARYAVYATTASRALLQVPTFCIPPLLLDSSWLPFKAYVQTHPSAEVPITTFLLLLSFGIGLPIVIGLVPQRSTIKATDVESKFTNLGYDYFYFDKGL